MIKGNNGVTLVALVITIIVLLILAGVSISLVVGDNGVANQAADVTEENDQATVETEIKTAVMAVVSDWQDENNINEDTEPLNTFINKDSLEANMNSKDYEIKNLNVNTGTDTYTTDIEYNGKTYYFVLSLTDSENACIVKSVNASSQP